VSARVLPFAGSQHRQAERLLPWLVNGTLEGDERATIERHVDTCADCQQQLAQWQALQDTCAMPAMSTLDPMPSFTRLRNRLQAPRARPPVSRWSAMRSAWTTAPLWLRGAVAAPCALLLALGGAWLAREQPAPYRMLGDTPAAMPASTDARLVVVFEPGASQARTQQLLRASQARIVDGPNEVGAYVLAVPAARVASVRDALRAAPGVSLVESLDVGPVPPTVRR
jgi:anti-sigma-K factor RskA